MNVPNLQIEWLPGRYAVCRLEPGDPVPTWASVDAGTFSHSQECENVAVPRLVCVTRTDRELSIVIDERVVPQHVKAERGFVAMRLVGQVDMATIGIFARLTTALADARVPVFVLSTYDTDYLLVREQYRNDAIAALSNVARFT